jgi:AcrR family transcriptional regulator
MSHNSRSKPKPRARKVPVQQRSRATVAVILEAAARVLEQRGHAGFSTNHVAKRAGVSIGSIYQYFTDKNALLAALVSQVVDETERAMIDRLSNLRGRSVSNRAWARAFIQVWSESHGQPRHPLLHAVSSTLPHVHERGEAALAALSHEVEHHLRRCAIPSPALRARVVVLIGLVLVHELVIASPRGPARRAAEVESARVIAAYLDSVTPR